MKCFNTDWSTKKPVLGMHIRQIPCAHVITTGNGVGMLQRGINKIYMTFSCWQGVRLNVTLHLSVTCINQQSTKSLGSAEPKGVGSRPDQALIILN